MQLESIVFDLGSVLVDWDPSTAFPEINDPGQQSFFFNNVCGNNYLSLTDIGLSWDEADEITCRKYPEWCNHIREFRKRWHLMIKGPIEETVHIMEKLKKRYRIFALTNWASDTFDEVRYKIPFFSTFDGIVVSGKEGVMKPDRRIYEILIERYDLDPEKSLFIDDRKENTDTGEEIGFRTHTFTTPERLELFLEENGILI